MSVVCNFLFLFVQTGNSYACIYKFWMNGRPPCKRMWVLDQCHNVIHALNLTPGAQLDFYKSKDGRFVSFFNFFLCFLREKSLILCVFCGYH